MMPAISVPLTWFLLAQISFAAIIPLPENRDPAHTSDEMIPVLENRAPVKPKTSIKPTKSPVPTTTSSSIKPLKTQAATETSTSSKPDKSNVPTKDTAFEKALCNTKHPDITPLDKPVIKYAKPATRQPKDYLEPRSGVAKPAIAAWQNSFFGAAKVKTAKLKAPPPIKPIRAGAATIVSLYFPHPNPKSFKSQDVYIQRIERLAKVQEQVIIYVAKSVSAQIKAMRTDPHWIVIDEYATIWDIPNNVFQKKSFEVTQRQIFAKMRATGTEKWKPSAIYDDAFYSAAYNAKAFIAFDAPLRNPFGSDRWLYMDGGLLSTAEKPEHAQPPGLKEPWDMLLGADGFLDTSKMDRSIGLTKNTGVVFPEYPADPSRGVVDINSKAFNDPLYEWQNKYFLGGIFCGNTLGMLNYAVRYMQTIDILDANGRYTGREEFITPIVGAMYPNTVFSQPVQALPKELADPKLGDVTVKNWKLMLLSYSTYGKTMLPAMRDPIAGRYCGPHTTYKPRGTLVAGKA
jgi:hypothetical protein